MESAKQALANPERIKFEIDPNIKSPSETLWDEVTKAIFEENDVEGKTRAIIAKDISEREGITIDEANVIIDRAIAARKK